MLSPSNKAHDIYSVWRRARYVSWTCDSVTCPPHDYLVVTWTHLSFHIRNNLPLCASRDAARIVLCSLLCLCVRCTGVLYCSSLPSALFASTLHTHVAGFAYKIVY